MERYLNSANNGNADAQFRVGKFITSNNNDQKAFGWYLVSAEQGNRGAHVIWDIAINMVYK